jgi:hypothetical protein
MNIRKSWPIAVLLVVGITALMAKLALSPLYPRYTADECRTAYAQSRTMSDTLRVDLHPYDPTRRTVAHRCGEIRSAAPSTVLSALPR